MVVHRQAKIVDRGSLRSAPERTGAKIPHEPHLFSVACSWAELFVWGKIWVIGKIVAHRKT